MKVYKGAALVAAGGNRVTVKEAHSLPFSAALVTEKFNEKVGDDLFLWARDRSQTLSAANMSSARSLSSGNGFSSGGYGNWTGGWYFNPYFNMFTFVPASGTLWNPWGYGFFSPLTIYSFYAPSSYWYGGGGAPGSASLGRPISGFSNLSTNQAVPLSRLQRSNPGGVPSLSSPIRSGSAAAQAAGFPTADQSMGSVRSAAASGGGAPMSSGQSMGAGRPALSTGMGGGGAASGPAPAGGGRGR